MLSKIIFLGLLLKLHDVCCETSIEKFNKLGSPFLETYWESHSTFPYDKNNCQPSNLQPNVIDVTDYAMRLVQIPSYAVNIVNIAFASADWSQCTWDPNHYGCQYLDNFCGLHIFYKTDQSHIGQLEQLKSDIRDLQSNGVIVKLAYGGEEWGNTGVPVKVLNSLSFCQIVIV